MNNKSFIITPYNSNIKYKYSSGEIIFKEVLPESLKFPYNLSILKNTLSITNNPLKNIILFKHSLHPGTYIETKIIGGFTYTDKDGIHQRLISVHISDERCDIITVKSFILDEIKFFLTSCCYLTKNKIAFGNFINRDSAIDIYNNSKIRYTKTYLGNSRETFSASDTDSDSDTLGNIYNSPASLSRKFSSLFRKNSKK